MVAIFAFIGALDYLLDNKIGVKEAFLSGLTSIVPSILSMVGIICAIPLVNYILTPIVVPAAHFFKIDPSIFASILANNMGGYQLAIDLAENNQIGLFSGLILSSMFGATIVYTIPVGMGLLNKKKHKPFAKGIMYGLITMPIGCFTGGLMLNLSVLECILNMLPMFLLSLAVICGFRKKEKVLFSIFDKLTKILNFIAIISLGIVTFKSISGINIFPLFDDIWVGLDIVVEMTIFQLGCLPLASFLINILKKPLSYIGKTLKLSTNTISAIPVCFLNANSTLIMMNDIDDEGVVLVSGVLTSGICTFTAHLSYTMAVAKEYAPIVVASKLISSLISFILIYVLHLKNSKCIKTANH